MSPGIYRPNYKRAWENFFTVTEKQIAYVRNVSNGLILYLMNEEIYCYKNNFESPSIFDVVKEIQLKLTKISSTEQLLRGLFSSPALNGRRSREKA